MADSLSPTTTTTPAPRAASRSCPHENFESAVNVNRNVAGVLTASVQVRCAVCRLPMRFAGAEFHTVANLVLTP